MSEDAMSPEGIQALATALSNHLPYDDILDMRYGQGAHIAAYLRDLPWLPEEVRSAIDSAVPSQKGVDQRHAVYAAVCKIVASHPRRR